MIGSSNMQNPNQQPNTEQPQPTPKPSGKKEFSRKVLVPVLVIVAAIIAYFVIFGTKPLGPGGKCLRWQPVCLGVATDPIPENVVKDETANPALSEFEGWQTYSNEEFGFSLSYPNNWEQNQLASGGGEFKLIASFEPGSIVPAGNNMTVFINEDSIDATKEDDEVNRLYT